MMQWQNVIWWINQKVFEIKLANQSIFWAKESQMMSIATKIRKSIMQTSFNVWIVLAQDRSSTEFVYTVWA